MEPWKPKPAADEVAGGPEPVLEPAQFFLRLPAFGIQKPHPPGSLGDLAIFEIGRENGRIAEL